MSRVAYTVLFFANTIVASQLRVYGSYVARYFDTIVPSLTAGCEAYEDSGACFGNQLVYRMSFSMGCFFVLTALLSVALSRGYENCCCLMLFQLPFYVAMLFASLFIPNSFFDGYADFARVASGAFIILQIVIIVDWAYNLRDFFLNKMENSERDSEARQALLESNYDDLSEPQTAQTTKWEGAYLAVVLVFLALSVAGLAMLFKLYAGCELNVTFIAITIFAMIIVTVFSVLSWVNVGLLPSAAVSCYLVFMCYQAVHSNPDDTCTSVDTSSTKSMQRSAFMNAALAALTITWTSWRTSATKTNLLSLSPSASRSQTRKHDINEEDAVILTKEEVAGDHSDNDNETEPRAVPEYQFHLLMILSCFYMAMVITNWGSSTGTDTADEQELTMWVKIVSQWAATGVFLWTLVAPSVLTDREFGKDY